MSTALLDEAGVSAYASRIALPSLLAGTVIFADGALGGGKTTFFRALLRALGVEGTVRSPTYTLVEEYQLPSLTVYHCDLYRLTTAADVQGLGIHEWYGDNSCLLVEWSVHGTSVLPAADMQMQFDDVVDQPLLRRLTCTGVSARGSILANALTGR